MVENEDKNTTPTEPKGTPNPEPINNNTPKPKEVSDLDRAEAANKEKAQLLEQEQKLMDRKEKLQAIQMVGGQTITGQSPKPKTEDEKWSEDAKKRYAGTGMDPTDDENPTTYS